MEAKLETASEYWDQIKNFPLIPLGNPLDQLLDGGLRKGLIHGIGTTREIMNPIYHQVLMNYHLTIPREEWQPVLLIDGINRFNPNELSRAAVRHHIPPITLLDNIKVSRVFQFYQMIECMEELLPNWVKNNPSDRPGLIMVVGITNDFQEMLENHTDDPRPKELYEKGVNPKPFQDLQKALRGFNKVLPTAPYILFLTTTHTKSLYKLSGGTYFRHFCNVIGRIMPHVNYTMMHLDQHPFLPEKSLRVWNRKLRTPTKAELKTKNLDFFM